MDEAANQLLRAGAKPRIPVSPAGTYKTTRLSPTRWLLVNAALTPQLSFCPQAYLYAVTVPGGTHSFFLSCFRIFFFNFKNFILKSFQT